MRILLTTIALFAFGLISCNEGDFAGGAASTPGSKNKKADKDDAPEDDSTSSPDGEDGKEGDDKDPGATTGTGGEEDLVLDDTPVDEGGDFSTIDDFDTIEIDEYIKKCGGDDALEKPDDKFVFATSEEVRNFVNERCKIALPNIGAIHSGDDTAKQVCLLKGYRTANVTFKREYSSPKDNFIAHWDPSAKLFLTHGASGWNTKIHAMECIGKLSKKCSIEKAKINCK